MFLDERNYRCACQSNSSSAGSGEKQLSARAKGSHPRMLTPWQRRCPRGTEIHQNNLHPVDHVLLQHAGKGSSTTLALTSDYEDDG